MQWLISERLTEKTQQEIITINNVLREKLKTVEELSETILDIIAPELDATAEWGMMKHDLQHQNQA